jgi:polyphosphate:AMP phosphotransferase
MFEVAELGQKIDHETFATRSPSVREALLDAQHQLKTANFPVIILIGGVEGAGKGETVNFLLEWLDSRGVSTHAMDKPSKEERAHPEYFRFWSRLPPKGSIGIFFGSWYTLPIVNRAIGQSDDAQFDHDLARIVDFEQMLTNENALLLKFWLHVTKKQQRKRFKKLESDPDTAWRVTKRDWKFHSKYDEFLPISAHALRRTSTGFAPWEIIEANDRRFRHLTVAEKICSAMEKRLAKLPTFKPEFEPTPDPLPCNPVSRLDLSLKLDKKEYEDKLRKFQGKLGTLSRQLQSRRRSVVALFEGSDAAGKGGCIRRITQCIDARFYRVIPIAAPSEEERDQPYLWRFWRHLPSCGRYTIFDRSWYGRVLVERVEGFCATADWRRAFAEINSFEEQLVESGVILLKFWLAIGSDEQLRRFQEREATGYKRYKLTDEDLRNHSKAPAYETAACEMFARTSTEVASWTLVEAEDKYHARIKVLRVLTDRLSEVLED